MEFVSEQIWLSRMQLYSGSLNSVIINLKFKLQ
jgi:hypothetical protein